MMILSQYHIFELDTINIYSAFGTFQARESLIHRVHIFLEMK